jgi:hypothetical protein
MDAPHVLTKNVSATAYDVRGGLAIDFAPRGAVSIDKGKMSASCTFTSTAVDRVGDKIEMNGIVTAAHELNPVVFWDHAKDLTLPIGKTKDPLGNYTVRIFDDYATQTTYFSQSLHEAEQIFSLIDEGIISANSIGFRPLKAKPLYQGNRRLGLHLIEIEMLEASWVGIGCNPEAIRAALSRDKICGKSLADSIRRSLSPLASDAPAWSRGVSLKAVGDDDGPVDSPELGEEAERLDIMADIIGGLLQRSRSTAKAWRRKDWDENKHPRADDGKFGSGHGGAGSGKPSSSSSNGVTESKPGSKPSKPAKKPAPKQPEAKPAASAPRAGGKQAQQAASKSIERILSGAITEASHRELVGHLEKLTVPQLNELRKQHGLKAEGRLKAQVIAKLSAHFNAKIVKQGTVDVDKVLTALKPYAKVPIDRDMVRFAKADYYSIKQQYGTLTVHRIKELAVDAAKSLRELPAGAAEDREHFKKRLAVCSWMAEQAKRDGIAGKVEPSGLHDFGANAQRIMLGEKLRGGKNGSPWTSFLIHGIRDEFDVDKGTNDEQIWANLKDPRGSRYKGPRLDAVLQRLRPDYGSMNQEQLLNVLPHLKERTDTFTPDIVSRASRGRKSWQPMRKDLTGWEESKHPRADDGKFGSGGGSSSRGSTTSKPNGEAKARREQATAKAREATNAAIKVGLAAAIKVATTAGHFEHVAVDWIADKVQSLPSPLRLPTIGVYKVSMATYAVGQKAVAAVAAERGNTPEQVERITKVCGIANAIGAKALPLTFELLGAHGAGPWLSGFAPLGSIGYLAFATATDPMATLRTARKAVAGTLKAVGVAKSQATANENMIAAMLDSLAAADDADLWMACYCVALDETGDAAKSLDVVRKIFGRKSAARKVDGVKSLIKRSAKVAAKGAPMPEDRHDDAPKTEVAGVPLGAKILRKLHSGLSSLAGEVTKMSSELDACEAKEAIGSMVGGLGSSVSEIEKHWGKWYKDHDLAAQDEEPVEETVEKAEGEGEGDDNVDDVLEALDGLGGDDEDDEDLTPEERQAAEKRIKALEQEITHLNRLQR